MFVRAPANRCGLAFLGLPHTQISRQYMAENMRLLIDIFGQPEACLIADIIQYLADRKTEFDPGTRSSSFASHTHTVA